MRVMGGGRNRALPNLILIGAMKCGTTSLHRYLAAHPQIQMSRRKELDFFIEERNWGRGVDWYRSHFSRRFEVRGEASPNYTDHLRFPGVPERMAEIVPEAKLVFVVRDPIERMVSHYIHLVRSDMEERTADRALTAPLEQNPYLRRSRYYGQLQRYLNHFPPSRLLVMRAEKLLRERRDAMRRLFDFLGVDPGFHAPRFRVLYHRSRRKRRKTEMGRRLARTAPVRLLRRIPMRYRWPVDEVLFYPFSRPIERPRLAPEIRSELWERLAPDVEELEAFAGRRFAEWRP